MPTTVSHRRGAGRGQLQAVAHHRAVMGFAGVGPGRHRLKLRSGRARWSSPPSPIVVPPLVAVLALPPTAGGGRRSRRPRPRRPSCAAPACSWPRRRWASSGRIVGFLTFLLAFDFRGRASRRGTSAWSPWVQRPRRLRRLGRSPRGSAGAATRSRCSIGSLARDHRLAALLAGLVGRAPGRRAWSASSSASAPTGGKLAFDSIVQRDAPDANRGRSFARFETRFQIIWVVGASSPWLIASRPGSGSS